MLSLAPAGAGPRIRAWLIDSLFKFIIFFCVATALGIIFGQYSGGPILIFLFLMEWFYPVWFEVVRDGMTPGKKAIGLKVIQADGSPISFDASVLRNLLLCVDFFPAFYGLGLLSMLTHKDFRRLGDIVAGTMVVHVEKPPRKAEAPLEVPEAPPLKFPIPLMVEEQQALTSFAERMRLQTQARNMEMAEILSPITKVKKEEAVSKVVGFANHIMGKK